MSVGAKDHIDQMLVKKYAKEQVNNAAQAEILAISADKYWQITKELAQVQQALLKVSNYMNNKKYETNKKFLSKVNPAVS